MTAIPRRTFLQAAGATLLTPALPRVATAQSSNISYFPGFEPRSGLRYLEREVGLVLDYSHSMDIDEVAKAIDGTIDGVVGSKLLRGGDVNCEGPIAIGVATFQSGAKFLGYMVLHDSQDAQRAQDFLKVHLKAIGTTGNTNIARGFDEITGMFMNSPFSGGSHKKMNFLVGDENNNTGGNPAASALYLAQTCGVTTHCAGLVPRIYQNIPTPENVTYMDGTFPVEVEPGELITNATAADIAFFMQRHIDPNCHVAAEARPAFSRRSLMALNRA